MNSFDTFVSHWLPGLIWEYSLFHRLPFVGWIFSYINKYDGVASLIFIWVTVAIRGFANLPSFIRQPSFRKLGT